VRETLAAQPVSSLRAWLVRKLKQLLTCLTSYSFDYDYNNIITVLVGQSKTNSSVYKDIICEKSKFFEAACAPDRWLEGNAKTVPLPHVRPETFKTYYHQMVTGLLLSSVHWGRETFTAEEEQEAFIEAYILGDFLDDAAYRRYVMSMLLRQRGRWGVAFNNSFITRIWEATPENSPLRTFTLEWMIGTWSRVAVAKIVEEEVVPKDFIKEAMLLMLKIYKPLSQYECDRKLRALLLPDQDDDWQESDDDW
jgi:hypothetical protein